MQYEYTFYIRVGPDPFFLPDAGCFSKKMPDARYPANAGLPDFLPFFRPKKAPLLRKAILHKKARVIKNFK